MRQYAPGIGAGIFLERAISRKATGAARPPRPAPPRLLLVLQRLAAPWLLHAPVSVPLRTHALRTHALMTTTAHLPRGNQLLQCIAHP